MGEDRWRKDSEGVGEDSDLQVNKHPCPNSCPRRSALPFPGGLLTRVPGKELLLSGGHEWVGCLSAVRVIDGHPGHPGHPWRSEGVSVSNTFHCSKRRTVVTSPLLTLALPVKRPLSH